MRVWGAGVAVVLGLAQGAVALAQQPAPPEKVAAVKQSFQESQARLRTFEWVETTVVSLKGEQKSKKQERCYYGAEGGIQKVPIGTPEQADMPGGLRGRASRNKQEEIVEYMDRAVALVKLYVPPDPARIQQSKDAGKASLHMLEPGKRARLDFGDYVQPGDVLGVEIDIVNNRILGVHVATSLDSAPVNLDITFAAFPDGTIHTSAVKLDAKAQEVTVDIQNTGYRNTGS